MTKYYHTHFNVPLTVATQPSTQEIIYLLPDQAIAMLPPGKTIHVTSQPAPNTIFGMDINRADIIALLQENPSEKAGPISTYSGHGIVVRGNPDLFIATATPLLAQTTYGERLTTCPACKTAMELTTIAHPDSAQDHERRLCTNCGAQWWHNNATRTYHDLVGATGNPLP